MLSQFVFFSSKNRCATIWNEQTVADLYDVRSPIAHGKIEAGHDPDDNLRLLEKVGRLCKLCSRKLIALDEFQYFATASSRDVFMERLDSAFVELSQIGLTSLFKDDSTYS